MIWQIPDGGLKENMKDPVQVLKGHGRKIGSVKFNPVANNILATSSADFSVKIWDIEKGAASISIDAQHRDIISSCVWNETGSLLATAQSGKDKKLRIVDPRAAKVISEVEGHTGIKAFRCQWMRERLLTVGFSKGNEREYWLWDPKNLSAPIHKNAIDSASGGIMPFFDPDTSLLFLAGKGDGNIRYYEVVDEDPYIHAITPEFKSAAPQKGMGMLPKRAVNVSECEIVRLYKLGTKLIEPITFCVPRKSELFQEDIYPEAFSGEYTLTGSEWIGGKDGVQKRTSLAPGFVLKPKAAESNFEKKEEKQLSEKEMKDEIARLTNRVNYLEAEMVKRDAKIADLEGKK